MMRTNLPGKFLPRSTLSAALLETSKLKVVWSKRGPPESATLGLFAPYDALIEFVMRKSNSLRPWFILMSKFQARFIVHSIPAAAEMSLTAVLISGRKPSG